MGYKRKKKGGFDGVFQTRTDLAIEAQEIAQGKGVEKEVPGKSIYRT